MHSNPFIPDRLWLQSEGWQKYQELRESIDIRDAYHLDCFWTETLFAVRRRSGPGPWEQHLRLVESFGREGFRILRLHRQQDYALLPWIEKSFLEFARPRLPREEFSLKRSDRFFADLERRVLARQMITILACDYRGEQQRDLAGENSLRRSLQIMQDRSVIISRYREPFWFWGREDLLVTIEKSLPSSEPEALRLLLLWVHLAAAEMRRERELPPGEALWRAFLGAKKLSR